MTWWHVGRCGAWAGWLAVGLLAVGDCNSPYPASARQANTLYTTFAEEPKHLDPASSYGTDQAAVLGQILEPPFEYHLLKRPYQLIPLTAVAVPKPQTRAVQWAGRTVNATVYTVRLKPGIMYQDHPCFVEANRHLSEADARGVRRVADIQATATRELVAADYVHAVRRLADPRLGCPVLRILEENILAMPDYREALTAALEARRRERQAAAGAMYSQEQDEKYNPIALDYAAHPFPGVQEIDRYTFEVALSQPYPQILYWMAMSFFAPVPPEAVEFFNQPVLLERSIVLDKNPVGTGPYVVADFDPANQMVLERNPNFRGERYPTLPKPSPDDARALVHYETMRAAGMLADAGRPLPMIDRCVFRREKEWIPRWNKFLQGYYDTSGISSDVFDQSITLTSRGDAVLSDDMERQGISLLTSPSPTVYYYTFNMNDPVVGGYSEKRKKLRRAVAIAFDMEEEIAIFRNGRGQTAHSPTPPGIFGYEEGEAGINPFVYRWDKARRRAVRRSLDEAKRLLAEAGYPDGYGPDGRPLTLRFDNAWTSTASRPRLQFVVKQFAKLGIRLDVRTTDYNRFQEKVLAGSVQFCSWGWAADYPDPENFLFLLYGPNGKTVSGSENSANYANADFDRLLVEMRAMDNSPERLAIIHRMNRILHEDAPWIAAYHPVAFTLVHEWHKNAYPNPVAFNTLKFARLDTALRARRRRAWNAPRWGPVLAFALCLAVASLPAVWAAVRHVRES